MSALIQGFIKRFLVLFSVTRYDYVFIHREVTPVGPPVFEWIIAKVLRRKIIYDFDDAIWLTDRKQESLLLRVSKWRRKVRKICAWSYKVSCGNKYLCNFARNYNSRVVLNPTTIDTDRHHQSENKNSDSQQIIIGWTGSHSTLKYLDEVVPVLQQIENRFTNVRFVVIADRRPDLQLRSFDFIKWNKESEVNDLKRFDIGIMPLPDDEWAKGKCGFKILQYMSVAVPSVASPVGVNTTIIQQNVNGFLASSENEWLDAITKLITNDALRKEFGMAGRKLVVDSYSIASNSDNFLGLFT